MLRQTIQTVSRRLASTDVVRNAATVRCGLTTSCSRSAAETERSETAAIPAGKQASDKVKAIADQIAGLNLLEAESLTQTMLERLRAVGRPGRLANTVNASKHRLGNFSLALQDMHAKKAEAKP
jgi:hypothetical protein